MHVCFEYAAETQTQYATGKTMEVKLETKYSETQPQCGTVSNKGGEIGDTYYTVTTKMLNASAMKKIDTLASQCLLTIQC